MKGTGALSLNKNGVTCKSFCISTVLDFNPLTVFNHATFMVQEPVQCYRRLCLVSGKDFLPLTEGQI